MNGSYCYGVLNCRWVNGTCRVDIFVQDFEIQISCNCGVVGDIKISEY